MRGFSEADEAGEWDMLVEARPLDIDHRVDPDTVDSLLADIRNNPPPLKGNRDSVFVTDDCE